MFEQMQPFCNEFVLHTTESQVINQFPTNLSLNWTVDYSKIREAISVSIAYDKFLLEPEVTFCFQICFDYATIRRKKLCARLSL